MSTLVSTISVVLADDTPDIRMLLRIMLSSDGRFDVVGEASDGQEAVSMAASHQPHVLILDMAMPVKDGLQALPEILAVSPDTKVVILSGFNAGDTADEARSLGASAYLEKGVAPERLISVLLELCPGIAAQRPDRRADTDQEPEESVHGTPVDSMMEHLALVAHELKSPLTAILGFASTLRQSISISDTETTETSIGAIERNGAALRSLIERLENAHRVHSGRLSLDREVVDVSAIVRETVESMEPLISPRPVILRPSEGTTASVDAARVQEILRNLVCNAAKFSPPDTTITVAVDQRGQSVEISVTDQGPGIPPGRESELFGKFSRLGSTVKGTGLGLFVSRGIARAHGGELSFERPEHPGARFVLLLPLSSENEEAESRVFDLSRSVS